MEAPEPISKNATLSRHAFALFQNALLLVALWKPYNKTPKFFYGCTSISLRISLSGAPANAACVASPLLKCVLVLPDMTTVSPSRTTRRSWMVPPAPIRIWRSTVSSNSAMAAPSFASFPRICRSSVISAVWRHISADSRLNGKNIVEK